MTQCLRELGQFADGMAYGTEALEVVEVGDCPSERLTVYSRVGPLQVRQGTLHTAIPLLEQAVVLSQDLDMPNSYRLAAPWLALAYARCRPSVITALALRTPPPASGSGRMRHWLPPSCYTAPWI